MWSCAIVCMMLVGAMAQKPMKEDHEEPCCAPRYFTFKGVDTITSAPDGELLVEFVKTEGAYDAISEQVAIIFDTEYFNGTEVQGRYIADFKEQMLYIIIKVGEEEHCLPRHYDDRFPEDCITDHAKFVETEWIGERDLQVDKWYFSFEEAPDSEFDVSVTVTSKDCVPVSRVSAQVNTITGELLEVIDMRTLDFNLGICDREHYFKVPEACHPDNALKKPTLAMQKILDKISRQRKFFGQ